MYWKIENNKVVEFYRQLPKVIGNTSIGKNITNEELKEFWILPVVWIAEPLEEWQSYWAKTYNILEDRIEENKEVIDESLEDYKARKIKQLSDKCKADIIAEYNEDDQRNATARAAELLDIKIDIWLTPEEQAELNQIKQVKVVIWNRLAEYHNQRDNITWLDTYQEVKDYVSSLYPNTEELWA